MRVTSMRACFAATVAAIAMAATAPSYASFEGFGQDIPLENAARQIVPEGWSVDYAEGVDRTVPVSWSSAPDWQGALKTATSRRGYGVTFGTNSVVISKAAATTEPARQEKTAVRPYSSSPAAGTAQKAPARPAAPRPSAAEAAVGQAANEGGGGFSIRPWKSDQAASGGMAGKGEEFEPYRAPTAFTVDHGQMLRPVLSDWASVSGWRVVWDSEFDYRIEAPATFQGDFVDAASALVGAMSSARPAITVDFFRGNRVMVVSNKSSDEVN